MTTESTLTELITPKTRDQLVTDMLAVLAANGFPITSWHTTSVPRRLLVAFGEVLANLWTSIASIARGGFVDTAERDWLTALAYNVYQVTRQISVACKGTCKVKDYGGGPHSIPAGSLWFSDVTGAYRYQYSGVGEFYTSGGSPAPSGTIPKNGYAFLEVLAEQPGVGYNLSTDAITVLQTQKPGLSFMAGEASYNPDSDWIITDGADEEDDTALAQRCREKWGTLGTGANEYAYQYWAKAAATSTPITRVKVFPQADGYPWSVATYVANGNADGVVSQEDLDIVSAALVAKRPACVLGRYDNPDIMAYAINPVAIDLDGTIYAYSQYASGAKAKALASLAAFFADVSIGKNVYDSQILQAAFYSTTELQKIVWNVVPENIVTGTTDLNVLGNTDNLSVVSV